MAPKSKPSSTSVNLSTVLRYILLVLISTKSANGGNITSITRQPNQDDSFDIASKQELLCPSNTCSKYNAQLVSGISDGCVCQCSSPRNTFYSKTYSCEESKYIVEEHGCSIGFKDDKYGILPVIDMLSTPGSLGLVNKMHGGCAKVKTSWFYLKNGTWHAGKAGLMSVTLKQHWIKPDKWFLKWYSGLPSSYSGIIIRVMVTCEHGSILDNHDTGCLMFKSQGTFKVKQENIIPTIPQTSTTATPTPSQQTTAQTPEPSDTTAKTESSTEYKPTQSTTAATKKQVTSTSTSPVLPTQNTTPKKEPRKETSDGDKKMWIAFAAGGVTILLVMVGSLIFFFLLCRQRKKQASRTEIEGQSSSRREIANDPLHDYEYVVYPVLTEGYQSSSSRSLDNAMYGRGPDNELIIRTPGISMESLATNSINHNREANHGNKRSSSAYYPRDSPSMNHTTNTSNTMGNSSHVYAQLQRKEKDSDVNSSGIYQPLIRPVTPDFNDNRPNENQDISLEPITSNTSAVPDYMVLEPDSISEHDASA